MGKKSHTVAVTPRQRNADPPPHLVPIHLRIIVLLILIQYLTPLSAIALAYLVTAFLVVNHLVASVSLRVLATRTRRGVQQSVVEASTLGPYAAQIQDPSIPRIQRVCAAFAFWCLYMTTLILMTVTSERKPMSDMCRTLPSSAYVAPNQSVEVAIGQAVVASVEVLTCAVVLEMNVALAEPTCKASPT